MQTSWFPYTRAKARKMQKKGPTIPAVLTSCTIFGRKAAATLLTLPALALVASGCGSTHTVTVTKSASTTAASVTSSTSSPPRGPPPCPPDVLDAPPGARCVLSRGVVASVGSKTLPARLKTLAARVVGLTTADTLSDGTSSASAVGRFVVVSLAVTNRAHSPETFDPIGVQQAALVEHKTYYSEDFKVENYNDSRSCVSQATTPIQPGESATCDVVFDLPATAIRAAADAHQLAVVVANFGDNLSPSSSSVPKSLGVVGLTLPAS